MSSILPYPETLELIKFVAEAQSITAHVRLKAPDSCCPYRGGKSVFWEVPMALGYTITTSIRRRTLREMLSCHLRICRLSVHFIPCHVLKAVDCSSFPQTPGWEEW